MVFPQQGASWSMAYSASIIDARFIRRVKCQTQDALTGWFVRALLSGPKVFCSPFPLLFLWVYLMPLLVLRGQAYGLGIARDFLQGRRMGLGQSIVPYQMVWAIDQGTFYTVQPFEISQILAPQVLSSRFSQVTQEEELKRLNAMGDKFPSRAPYTPLE